MRVVAGSAGGIPLRAPRADIRPTMDRVKAAIFSSLADLVVGARVLDLFAGTGALGIEALSRGATSADFVEKDQRAIDAMEKNLRATRLIGRIHALDVFSYLDRLALPGAFDLIFADPPYAKHAGERDFAPELLGSDSLHAALGDNGVFVLEHLPQARLALGKTWQCFREKRYGATAVAFLRPITGTE
jgi:16S rRNA (guanine966-N2)-methyltransferase